MKTKRYQLWQCPRCGTLYESPIRLSVVTCSARQHGTKPNIPMVLIEGEPLILKEKKR